MLSWPHLVLHILTYWYLVYISWRACRTHHQQKASSLSRLCSAHESEMRWHTKPYIFSLTRLPCASNGNEANFAFKYAWIVSLRLRSIRKPSIKCFNSYIFSSRACFERNECVLPAARCEALHICSALTVFCVSLDHRQHDEMHFERCTFICSAGISFEAMERNVRYTIRTFEWMIHA